MEQFEASRGQSRAAVAWEQFVRDSYPTVWRFCAALADDTAADDLAQETFLRATRALPQFRGQANQRTWLLAIARRACIDELRGRYRRERRDQRVTQPGSAQVADASDEIATRQLLRQLEPDRRIAFVLTQLFGLTYEETAHACDCPIGTVRSRVARAREDLIALMGNPRAASRQHTAE